MKMKNRNLSYTALLLGMLAVPFLTACEGVDEVEKGEKAADNDVVLEISAPHYSAEWNEGTRALVPLTDDLQKQIHNLWYYFYNEKQMLTYVFHQNIRSTTTHQVKFSEFEQAAKKRGVTFSHSEGYIYIVANSENMDNSLSDDEQKPKIILEQADRPTGDYEAWRASIGNVDGFKANALLPLYISGRYDPNTSQLDYPSVGKPGHLMLFGSFHGKSHSGADESHTMSIVLGRAVSRLRVALSGEGLGPQARITIQNAPIVTTLFPDAQQLYTDNNPTQDCWMDYMEMVSEGNGITGTAGNRSVSTYYYCGENSTHDYPIKEPTFGDQDASGTYTGKVSTTLIVETWDTKNDGNTVTEGEGTNNPVAVNVTSPSRTYKVVLGHDIPAASSSSSSSTAGTPRDLNLYRNTSYTFNINLMTGQPPSNAKEHTTRTAEPNKDGSITLYPIE